MKAPEQRAREAARHVLDEHNSDGQLPVPVERIADRCGCKIARNQDPASDITCFAAVSAIGERAIGINTAQGVRKPITITLDPTLPPNGMQITYADGTVSRSAGFGSAPVAPSQGRVEITYTQAPRVTLTDEASEVLFEAAQKIGRASGAGAECVYGVLLRALANWEQAKAEASDG